MPNFLRYTPIKIPVIIFIMSGTICKVCGKSFDIEQDDILFYEKVKTPPPTLCPTCRLKRRMAFRNERNFYQRTCGLCGKNIISAYSSDKPFVVYCQDCWWGDKWDPMSYGQDMPTGRAGFDFSKSFFEQYQKFQMAVPRLTLMNRNSENSEYCNYAGYNKNCYLCFGGSWYNEDCLYGRRYGHCKSSVDCESVNKAELCYESLWSANIYECVYCFDSSTCSNCYFSTNLKGCMNCIFCSELRNKNYHVFNKPVRRAEFESYAKKMKLFAEFSKMLQQFKEMLEECVRPWANVINCTDCIGDYLVNCKNIKYGYDVIDGEDGKYLVQAETIKDSMDCTSCGYDTPQLFYETVNTGNGGYHNRFCFSCWNCSELNYCDTVMNSHDCFGCISLNRKEYCIFNKKYGKEEYEKLSAKIIEHMKKTGEFGEMFPMKLSPFAYNETIAQDYFPATKEAVLKAGLSWKDSEEKNYKQSTFVIPDNIEEVSDNITNEVLACSECGKNYKIIAQELRLYRLIGVPVPRKCFSCRQNARTELRDYVLPTDAVCTKCGATIKTGIRSSSARLHSYCEKCYLKEVY